MEKPPAFQLYAKDFIEGTSEMSNAETGAYIKLLCHQWLKEGLKNDNKILIRLCNGDSEGIEIAKEKFETGADGLLKNKRLEKTRKENEEYRKSKAEAGAAGAKKRWQKNGTPIVLPSGLPLANGIANDSPAPSSPPAINSKLSRSDVYRIMRGNTNRKIFSDSLIENETDAFILKYEGKNIKHLDSLVNGWIANISPDIKPRDKNSFI